MRKDQRISATITALFLLGILAVQNLSAVWDKTKPADTSVFRQADDLIRANNDAIEAALDAEHYFVTGGTQTGAHRPGGASILRYETTATIDADIITTGIYVHDGLLFDTDLDAFYTMNSDATAKVALTLGTDAVDFIDVDPIDPASDVVVPTSLAVATHVASGTVTMTNKTLTTPTLTSPVINTGVSGTAIDATATLGTSDTLLPTQKAVKTYVDTQVATHGFYSSTAVVFPTGHLTAANTWQTLDLSAAGTPAIGANKVLVFLKVVAAANIGFAISPDETGAIAYQNGYTGPNQVNFSANAPAYFTMTTDSNGYVKIGGTGNSTNVTITLLGYIK